MHLKSNPEDNGEITKAFLKKLVKSDPRMYYTTAHLNDVLYLHYKGFEKITNLQDYTGLKVIYLEGNAIKKIAGLENMVNLKCLYLHENLIRKMENLDSLYNLKTLNLTDNLIEKIEGLDSLKKMQNLQLRRNKIGHEGLEDLIGLLKCPSLSGLDLSANNIQDTALVQEILMQMPNMAVVYLQQNGFCKKIAHYRKHLISKIPTLKYIDDKPIFEEQRRCAEAWAKGGLEEERKQREVYRKQKEEYHDRQHREFMEMMERYKEEAKKEKEESASENQSDSRNESLETYNTPEQSENTSKLASQQSQKSSQKDASEHEQQSVKSEEQENRKSANLDELD